MTHVLKSWRVGISTQVTRGELDKLVDAGQVFIRMKSEKWWQIRRNGKTRTWKRNANRFALPFKYGLYGYGTITEADLLEGNRLNPEHFRHSDDFVEW
jgi:hypothetical protein